MSPNYPACYIIIRKEDSFLFVLRENTGFMDGNYSLPAGRVEENERFSTGAIREALEEIGITIDPANITHVFTQHRFSETSDKKQWVDVFFEASEWTGEPTNTEPDKHSRIEWLSIGNLPANIMDYQRHALVQIAAGESYGEFGWPVTR
jgi:8-oxo-dGTP diphosphatase